MDETGSESSVRTLYRGLAVFWTNLCLCLLLINLIAAVVLLVWRPGKGVPVPAYVDEAFAEIYEDWPEADRLALREENNPDFEAEALVQFREKRAGSRFVNLDENGFRVVREQGPWPPDERYFNVFVLGGSTTFGYGVPDEESVPSHIQDLLSGVELPRPPRVYNFGRGAFYSTMERILFDKLLTLGPTPDLVLFIDGLNEFYWEEDPPKLTAAWTERVQGMLENPSRAALETLPIVRLARAWSGRADLEAFGTGPRPALSPRVAERKSDRVIARYRANKVIIEALAAVKSTPVVMVWQPVPTYSYDLRYHVYDGNFGRNELARVGYPRMRQSLDERPLGENFIWCAEIQRDIKELLYVDQVHYSPEMSWRVARCIVDALVDRRLLSPGHHGK